MKKELFTIRDATGHEQEVLGVRIDSLFAWTALPQGGTGMVDFKPTTLTHLPTGLAVHTEVPTRKVAGALAAACLDLPGVTWTSSDVGAISSAVRDAVAPKTVPQWVEETLLAAKPVRQRRTRLDEVLSSAAWKGSVVESTTAEFAELSGDCGCDKERHARVFYVDRKGDTHVAYRHYETVPAVKLTHPSGAWCVVRDERATT